MKQKVELSGNDNILKNNSKKKRIGNDRYLHFSPCFRLKNEFLLWAINISSDGEDEIENQDDNNEKRMQLETNPDLYSINSYLRIEYIDKRQLSQDKDSKFSAVGLPSDVVRRKGKLASENDMNLFEPQIPYEELIDLSLEDWINLKAEEAGISFAENISQNPLQLTRNIKKTKRKHLAVSKSVETNHTTDSNETPTFNKIDDEPQGIEEMNDYWISHRAFELTSFDQLLKDSPLTKRIISVDALNQGPVNSTSFMKLFRPEQQKKVSIQNVAYSHSNELKVVTALDNTNSANNGSDEEFDDSASAALAQAATPSDGSDFIQLDEDRNNLLPIPSATLFQLVQDYQHLQQLQLLQPTFSTNLPPSYFRQHHHITQFQAQHHYQTQNMQMAAGSVYFLQGSRRNSPQLQNYVTSSTPATKRKSLFAGGNASLIDSISDAYFPANSALTDGHQKLSLNSGLKDTMDVYAFVLKEPTDSDMKKYKRYASMSFANKKLNESRSVENDGSNTTEDQNNILSRCKLAPLFEFNSTFFTVDSAFHTEIGEVSDTSLETYHKRVLELNSAKNYPDAMLQPLVTSLRVYAEHDLSTQYRTTGHKKPFKQKTMKIKCAK